MDDVARFALAGAGLLVAAAVIRTAAEWLVAYALAWAVGLMCRSRRHVS